MRIDRMGSVEDRFKSRFEKVVGYWTADAFPDKHKERALYKTKDLSTDEMERLCELLIDNCERPPSIVKIIKFAYDVRRSRMDLTVNARQLLKRCRVCDGDGHFSAIKVVDGHDYTYAFRCPSETCEAARLDVPMSVPVWSDSYRGEYIPRDELHTIKKNSAKGIELLAQLNIKKPTRRNYEEEQGTRGNESSQGFTDQTL